MKKLRNWIFAILGIGAVGAGAVYTTNQLTSEKVAVVKPVITITTTDSKPLVFQMGTNLVDLCFMGGAARKVERNLLDTNFLKLQRGLNFFRGVQIAFGSISQYGHVVLAGTGIGYNFHVSDFSSPSEYNNYGGNVCCGWRSDFYVNILQFTKALPMVCDVNLNIKNGTWAEHKKLIEDYNPDYIGFQSESVTDDNFSIEQYIAKASPVRDSIKKYFPTKKIILDCGLVYRSNPKTQNWNAKIYPPFTDAPFGRWYLQTGDREVYNYNQDSNIIKLDDFCDVGIPSDIAAFKTVFPTWKMIGEEILLEDNRGETKYLSKIAEVYGWAAVYIALVENQDMIPVGYQMADKNLVSDTSTSMYKTIALLNNFLHSGKQVNKITFTEMSGVEGLSISDGTTYTLLLKNAANVSYTLTNVKIDGGTTSQKIVYTVQSISSTDFNSAPIYATNVSTGTYTIPQTGICVISFTKK